MRGRQVGKGAFEVPVSGPQKSPPSRWSGALPATRECDRWRWRNQVIQWWSSPFMRSSYRSHGASTVAARFDQDDRSEQM